MTINFTLMRVIWQRCRIADEYNMRIQKIQKKYYKKSETKLATTQTGLEFSYGILGVSGWNRLEPLFSVSLYSISLHRLAEFPGRPTAAALKNRGVTTN